MSTKHLSILYSNKQTANHQIHLPDTSGQANYYPGFGAVLQKYRVSNDLSQNKLAEMMETSRNTITNWETDKSRPDTDTIRRLCKLLGIPLYELFGLENDSIPSVNENILLQQYRQLSPVSQKFISQMIATMLQEETDARDHLLRTTYTILPLHSTSAAAGTGNVFVDTPPEPFFIQKNAVSDDADAIIRVSGASMEPLYHDGDMVYIAYTHASDNGDDVVCATSDGAVIKRVQDNKLVSLNKALPFGDKTEDAHVVILGKVLGIVQRNETAPPEDIPALEELLSHELREFDQKYGR